MTEATNRTAGHLTDCECKWCLMEQRDALAGMLEKLLGNGPDRYGYGAAANALNDGLREEARAVLARVRGEGKS